MSVENWLLLLLLGLSCAAGVVETVPVQLAGATAVQQQNGKLGLLVPLSVRQGYPLQHGRHLLKHGAITPVLGAVRQGYFYAQLLLGTPPKAYSTIIDTGSSITYIPCSRCRSCGKQHMATPFDPSKSSTARWLGCTDKQCQCGTPACSCREQTCYYTRHYAEDSSSEGWMVADKLHLPAATSSSSGAQASNSTKAVDVVFGCENVETGEIFKQRVDGVLGMGNNAYSFPRQLARSGVVEDMFSLCYGFPEGGSMLLGDIAVEPPTQLAYTSFVTTPHNYYTISTQSMSLNGKKLDINPADFSKGYGTVLDSGTTFTYLPTSAYKAFYGALQQAIKAAGLQPASGSDPSYNDVCWEGAPDDWDAVNKLFPKGNMTFAGGAYIELVPYRYLFKASSGRFCLGVFDNGWQGTLMGGIITRNVLVQYDKEKGRVGFGHTDCNAIKPVRKVQQTTDAAAEDSQEGSTEEIDPHEAHDQQQGSQQSPTTHSSAGDNHKQQQQAADAAEEQGPEVSGGSGTRHRMSSNQKLLWLGVAVAALLVLAIVQLAVATLRQPAPGSGKGGGTCGGDGGGLLPRAFGADNRSYHQVGTSDDQELVEFSDRTQLTDSSLPTSQHLKQSGPQQPVQQL